MDFSENILFDLTTKSIRTHIFWCWKLFNASYTTNCISNVKIEIYCIFLIYPWTSLSKFPNISKLGIKLKEK